MNRTEGKPVRQYYAQKLKSLILFHWSNNTYCKRTPEFVRRKFYSWSADFQKFTVELRRVVLALPSDANEKNIASMAISVSSGMCSGIKKSSRKYRHDIWRNPLSFKVLWLHPMYSDERTFTSWIASSITEMVLRKPCKLKRLYPLLIPMEETVWLLIP